MKKKFLCLILALAMLLSLVACGGNNNTDTPSEPDPTPADDTNTPTEPEDDGSLVAYTYDDDEVYENALGDFYNTYMKAFDASNNSERWALMAIAEGKLMGSGVMIPLTTAGGYYGFRHTAPRTTSTVMWGNDTDRTHSIIVTNELVKGEDWEAMKSLWVELRGTGTYYTEVQKWLGEHGYTIGDTYSANYTYDPLTWDALATQRQADSQAIIMTLDNLVEYDCENEMQPALAESWEHNDDFTEFTFHIRQGVNWVDSQGREIAPVQADDWVAGYQHMLDANKESSLTANLVKGATEYISGEITDFSQVGVEAVDQYTLKYTLSEPCSYFLTMMTYSTVASPLCRSFYESHGGQFGINEYDQSAADYTYGKGIDNIAYNGPYLVTSNTEKSMIVFQANPAWWNADSLLTKTVNWYFNDGTDATKSYQDFKAGLVNNVSLNAATIETAKAEGQFDEYHVISDTNSTSYMGFVNLNRQSFANDNDPTKLVSPQSHDSVSRDPESGELTVDTTVVDDAARTHVAINNKNFRLALCLAMDHATYNAQAKGEELKLVSLRNSYTPGNFMYLEEAVTVDINGTATTFEAGTAYGAIMQAQLDADGIPVKVWDAETGSCDGYDGWYNPTAAKEYLAKAVEELAELNCEVSAENPIYIDLPFMNTDENYTNKATSFKQSVEKVTDGMIIVNTVGGSSDDWHAAGYDIDNGYQSNYDVYDLSGWGPDYGDPSTYLDTMLPDGNGYMAKCIGLY